MAESESTVFTSLDEILAHFSGSQVSVEGGINQYRSQLKQFTGHDPNTPLTALDVVKIVQKVFFAKSPESVVTDKVEPQTEGEHVGNG